MACWKLVLAYKYNQTPMQLPLNPRHLHMDAGSKAEEQWCAPSSAYKKGTEGRPGQSLHNNLTISCNDFFKNKAFF